MPFDRFDVALEWMGMLPLSSMLRSIVAGLQTLLALVFWFGWLLYVYFQNRSSLRSDPALTRRANQDMLKQALIRFSLLLAATCALACFSVPAYLWATREPEYLQTRIESAPESVALNVPFPIILVIENTGSKAAGISKIQATVWEPDGAVVSEKLLFILTMPAASVNTYGPQPTLEYPNLRLLPGETLRLEKCRMSIGGGLPVTSPQAVHVVLSLNFGNLYAVTFVPVFAPHLPRQPISSPRLNTRDGSRLMMVM